VRQRLHPEGSVAENMAHCAGRAGGGQRWRDEPSDDEGQVQRPRQPASPRRVARQRRSRPSAGVCVGMGGVMKCSPHSQRRGADSPHRGIAPGPRELSSSSLSTSSVISTRRDDRTTRTLAAQPAGVSLAAAAAAEGGAAGAAAAAVLRSRATSSRGVVTRTSTKGSGGDTTTMGPPDAAGACGRGAQEVVQPFVRHRAVPPPFLPCRTEGRSEAPSSVPWAPGFCRTRSGASQTRTRRPRACQCALAQHSRLDPRACCQASHLSGSLQSSGRGIARVTSKARGPEDGRHPESVAPHLLPT